MSNYNSYITYLHSLSEQEFSNQTKKNSLLPQFNDLKRLANHYEHVLNKFHTCSSEYGSFIEDKNYSSDDFDYYQDKFIKLKKTDQLLSELSTEQIPISIKNEIVNYIKVKYDNTSLYDLRNIEDEIYSYHNKIVDVAKYEKYQKEEENRKAKNRTILIIVVAVIVLIIILTNI